MMRVTRRYRFAAVEHGSHVGHLEDRGLGIVVQRHQVLDRRQAGQVLAGARDPDREVEAEEAEGCAEGEQLRDINTPESLLLSNEIAETVNSTIEELPEELRTAIQMREIEGMSYEDIAKAMNCPIGTVRSRMFRAREAIAEQLRPLLGTRKDKRW